jgi:phospholipid/cholesterol/gamma-HCH transport system substrate-binding protein
MTREQRFRALGLVGFVVASFLIASLYFHAAGTNLLPGGASPYTVQAIVPTSVALAPDADVRIAGVNVGKVDGISASGPEGTDSLVKFELDSHSPVYRDAQVYVRTKSVAGENYIEINPGTPTAGALPSGGLLGLDHAAEATQIDQILSVFDQARQQDLQRALYGLGTGLSGGGRNLNRTLEAVSALPSQGSSAAALLSTDRAQVASLVNQLGAVTGALGSRAASIQTLTHQMRVAAQAVLARDAQLHDVLDLLPPFLIQARTTAGKLQTFATIATPVVHNLRVAAEDLVPAVRVLQPAARQGRTAVKELRGFADAAAPAIRQLRPFATQASALVPQLEAFLRPTKPLVTFLAPYVSEIGAFFGLDAASLQAADGSGHVARIILPVSTTELAGALTPSEQAIVNKLVKSFTSSIGQNAYPAPGQLSATTPFSGSYPRLTPDPPYAQ